MKKLFALFVLAVLAITPVFADGDSPIAKIVPVYESETGITIITGTVTADVVENLPVEIYCEHEGFSSLLDTVYTDASGVFGITVDNNNEAICVYEDTVWAILKNPDRDYSSPNVMVETNKVYDYADADIMVPEFGAIAALTALGLAGLFIYRRRR